jgi:ferredoxin
MPEEPFDLALVSRFGIIKNSHAAPPFPHHHSKLQPTSTTMDTKVHYGHNVLPSSKIKKLESSLCGLCAPSCPFKTLTDIHKHGQTISPQWTQCFAFVKNQKA